MSIQETYERVAHLAPWVESYAVVKAVEEHRKFWKPTNVKTVLLAESHVYTSETELGTPVRYTSDIPFGCPRDYVKLVYCLPYGEDDLLVRPLKVNKGTSSFWQLFAACASDEESQVPRMVDGVLKTRARDGEARIKTKVQILKALKDKGIWLLDASIVALYKSGDKPSAKIMRDVVRKCWHGHLSSVLRREKPIRLVVVGKMVAKNLRNDIAELKHQLGMEIREPISQGRLPRKERDALHRRLYRICSA